MVSTHSAQNRQSTLFKRILLAFMIYSVLSMATIPFIDSIWLGEIPLLAIIQCPKTMPANLIRSYYASDLAKIIGTSKGSFSPDYLAVRPYALLAVYLLPLSALIGGYVLLIKNKKGTGKYLIALILLSVLDYFCTLHFAHTPGLTIY